MANPRLLSSYSAVSACRCARTSSTGSSRAVARDISLTGASMTISTASMAARAPPAKSLMSNATCSCRISLGTSLNWVTVSSLRNILRGRDALASLDLFVELVADPDLAGILAAPLDHQLSERLALVEDEYRLMKQLQQRQKARNNHQGAVGIGDKRTK